MQIYGSFDQMAAGTGALAQRPMSQMSVFNNSIPSGWRQIDGTFQKTLGDFTAIISPSGGMYQIMKSTPASKGCSQKEVGSGGLTYGWGDVESKFLIVEDELARFLR